MKLAPLVNPAARRPSPKPVQVDLRTVFAFGTLYWAMPLVAFVMLQASGRQMHDAIIICAAGVVIGVLLLIWEHFNRARYRHLAQ